MTHICTYWLFSFFICKLNCDSSIAQLLPVLITHNSRINNNKRALLESLPNLLIP